MTDPSNQEYISAYLELVGYILAGRSNLVETLDGEPYYYVEIDGNKYYLNSIVPGVQEDQTLNYQIITKIYSLVVLLKKSMLFADEGYIPLLEGVEAVLSEGVREGGFWLALDPQYFQNDTSQEPNRQMYATLIANLLTLGKYLADTLGIYSPNPHLDNMFYALTSGCTWEYVVIEGERYYYFDVGAERYWCTPATRHPNGRGYVPMQSTAAYLLIDGMLQFFIDDLPSLAAEEIANYFRHTFALDVETFINSYGDGDLHAVWVAADPRRVGSNQAQNQSATNSLTFYLLGLGCLGAILNTPTFCLLESLFIKGVPLVDSQLFNGEVNL